MLLTGTNQLEERIRGLDAGADDYGGEAVRLC
jgi:DNA-binding response OmpR family regulator